MKVLLSALACEPLQATANLGEIGIGGNDELDRRSAAGDKAAAAEIATLAVGNASKFSRKGRGGTRRRSSACGGSERRKVHSLQPKLSPKVRSSECRV